MGSLEAGFSHDIFVDWASDVKNLVLFTERGQVCSLLLIMLKLLHFLALSFLPLGAMIFIIVLRIDFV